VLEVDNELEDIVGQAASVHPIHVCQHDDPGEPVGTTTKRGARALLPACVGGMRTPSLSEMPQPRA